MAEPSTPQNLRANPFWAYRDPSTGRWVTVMSSIQCQQLNAQVFSPQVRQSVDAPSGSTMFPADDAPAP